MEGGQNPFDDDSNIDAIDADVKTMVNPMLLSPSFVADPKPSYFGDEDETDGGNSNGGKRMAFLEIPSSKDDISNDMSLREGTNIIVPSVGMKFQDENEVFEFYKNYAYQIGFPVRKRNSKKGDDGVVRYVTFTCSRESRRICGTNVVMKPQATMQTGCKARLTACSELSGTWRINTVHLEHNHRTSPSKSRLYRCNREISARVRRQLEINDLAGIPLHKSLNSAVVEVGGYEKITCVEKD